MTFPATHLLQTSLGFLPARKVDVFAYLDADGVELHVPESQAFPCRRVDGRWAVDSQRATSEQLQIAIDLGLRTC